MVIGITGSIACGKSLISKYLLDHNYDVIDSDDISHAVLHKDIVKQELIENFGEEIVTNNTINRKMLGQIIFLDPNKKKELETIVFPHIQKEIKLELSKRNGLVFLDAPLLLEYNLEYLVDKIIVVKVDKEVQLERLMARDNITLKLAYAKVEAQWPIEEKLKYANFIIDNSNSREDTIKQLQEILKIVEE